MKRLTYSAFRVFEVQRLDFHIRHKQKLKCVYIIFIQRERESDTLRGAANQTIVVFK